MKHSASTHVSNPIKEMVWVKENLGSDDVIVVDCRYNLMDPSYGRSQYLKSHIRGAYFMDLLEDLTGPINSHGGRHPLPDMMEFAEKMKNIGVAPTRTVVCYDDNWSGAARLYFLLHYCGFRNVYVMNGLFQNWVDNGFPVSNRIPKNRNGNLSPILQNDLIKTMDEVKRLTPGNDIVDCRTSDRYRGENENIDPVAGHIPGAVNRPFVDSVHASGYRSPEELSSIFSGISDRPVLYCGSGVTACVNFIAMRVAGKDPVLYPGSWSDWISYKDNPVKS